MRRFSVNISPRLPWNPTINGHKEKPHPLFKREFKYVPTIIYSFSTLKPNINTIYIDEKNHIV